LESIPISITASPLGLPAPSPTELARIKSRLAAFDASDRDRLLREEALNELESFIYRSRDLTEDEEFAKVLTSEQLVTLTERVSTASDWLYGDGADAKTAEFKEKLKSLKEIVEPALKRKQESAVRPARIQLLQDSLKNAQMVISVMEKQIAQDEEIYSSSLAASSSSTSESESSTSSAASASAAVDLDDLEDDAYASSSSTSTGEPSAALTYSVFHPSDLTSLSETYETANTWLEARLAAQEKLSETDDAALTVAEIDTNLKRLERVMNRIYEKMGAAATKKASNDKPPKKNGKKDKEQAKDKEPVKEDTAPEKEKPTYNKKDEL
jgi:hypoxia up-regulated 1